MNVKVTTLGSFQQSFRINVGGTTASSRNSCELEKVRNRVTHAATAAGRLEGYRHGRL